MRRESRGRDESDFSGERNADRLQKHEQHENRVGVELEQPGHVVGEVGHVVTRGQEKAPDLSDRELDVSLF